MSRSGADLAQLLLGGFRILADQATVELTARGYEEIRPAQEFALQAILSGADNASDLGPADVGHQAGGGQTIAALEERNYVAREPDPADKRRMRLYVTSHGLAMLREGEEIFNRAARTVGEAGRHGRPGPGREHAPDPGRGQRRPPRYPRLAGPGPGGLADSRDTATPANHHEG